MAAKNSGPAAEGESEDGAAKAASRSRAEAAKRALAEAEERRSREATPTSREFNGRGGLDPARYGDWEVKGIASDF
jgi:hypothetical protein